MMISHGNRMVFILVICFIYLMRTHDGCCKIEARGACYWAHNGTLCYTLIIFS